MGYLLLAIALLLNAAANILLKMGANRIGHWRESGLFVSVVANPALLSGLLLFVLNVVFYCAALTRLNLATAYPVMTAGGVLIVVSFSTLYLQEAVTPVQLGGVLLLVVGIVLVTHR